MRELLGVYVDGETKTGKGAAGKHIAEVLEASGLKVCYDVAGDFYRRFASVVRQDLGLGSDEPLPTGETLEAAAQQVYDQGRVPFDRDAVEVDLQNSDISNSVSVLGRLAIAQRAGAEWWANLLEKAREANADVLVVDARNPRARINEQLPTGGVKLRTVLDLYMLCDPEEAARRTLRYQDNPNPTTEELNAEAKNVINRRDSDRKRPVNPFVMPVQSEHFDPSKMSAAQVIERSWQPHGEAKLPLPITLDNTNINEGYMLSSVAELAKAAIEFAPADLAA